MRNRLDEQLELLNTELIRMGALCEDGISQAAKVLVTRDEALRRAVDETEQEIDRKEREIEAICLRLLLQQQPVAKDLRLISAAMKMIYRRWGKALCSLPYKGISSASKG